MITRKLLLYINLFFVFTISSCQSRFLDVNDEIEAFPVKPLEGYQVGSVAWLSDYEIVFVGKQKNSDRKTPNLFLIYSTLNDQWQKISIPINQNCQVSGFSFVTRLPNKNIGYVDTCISNEKEIRNIYEINISNNEIKKLIHLEIIKVGGKFSFSPDMTELVQEDMESRFLSNKIYYENTKKTVQIVPEFTRAMYPDWSPHERQIVFWGTESYGGGKPEDFQTLPEILELSSNPWDLFISTPEGTNVVKIFSSVEDAMLIKWSPTERIIAFSGTVDGASGVFLINPKTLETKRIWSKLSDFDWSPDGKKLVVINNEKDKSGNIQNQNISIITIE